MALGQFLLLKGLQTFSPYSHPFERKETIMSQRPKILYEILARQPFDKIYYSSIYAVKDKINAKLGTQKTNMKRIQDCLLSLEKIGLIKRYYKTVTFYSKKQKKQISIQKPYYIIVKDGGNNEIAD